MLLADTVQRLEAPITQTLPIAQHANLHFVTPTLAIGGDVSPGRSTDQLADLDSLGITHVVDCRIEWDDAPLFARHLPHVGYLHHGMDDAGQDVPMEWFDAAMAWIDAAGPDAVVLTHCHMGINRGPSLGFAVLLHGAGGRSDERPCTGLHVGRQTDHAGLKFRKFLEMCQLEGEKVKWLGVLGDQLLTFLELAHLPLIL